VEKESAYPVASDLLVDAEDVLCSQ
jgi:hypothetical protein